jgi:phage anti-repressor protein
MKTVQINKVKVRIFEETELKEKIGLNNEEINLILEYQDKFPELLQDDIEGFIIDARKLHNQLKLQQDFSHWIKNQIKNLELDKEKSYTSLKTNCTTMQPKANIEYYLTLDSAKDICMTIGSSNRTNKETKELSKMVRNYFKLMEKTLRKYESWNMTREPEKQEYNIMVDELKKWCGRNNYEIDDKIFASFRARESNMINQNLTGKVASEIKTHIGYKDSITRDHLNEKLNSAILELQKLNTNLLIANMDFETRNNLIKTVCITRYRNLYIK